MFGVIIALPLQVETQPDQLMMEDSGTVAVMVQDTVKILLKNGTSPMPMLIWLKLN